MEEAVFFNPITTQERHKKLNSFEITLTGGKFSKKSPAKKPFLKFANKSSICLNVIKNQDWKVVRNDNSDVFWDTL